MHPNNGKRRGGLITHSEMNSNRDLGFANCCGALFPTARGELFYSESVNEEPSLRPCGLRGHFEFHSVIQCNFAHLCLSSDLRVCSDILSETFLLVSKDVPVVPSRR